MRGAKRGDWAMAALGRLKGNDRLAVEAFRHAVRSALGPELVELKLFGSKARGTDSPDSDIDVFVVVRCRTAAVVDRVIDIAFDANLAYNVYISPRVVGESILSHPFWSTTPFLKAVAEEGVKI